MSTDTDFLDKITELYADIENGSLTNPRVAVDRSNAILTAAYESRKTAARMMGYVDALLAVSKIVSAPAGAMTPPELDKLARVYAKKICAKAPGSIYP